MGKTRENTGMAADESQKQKKEVIAEAKKAEQYIFASQKESPLGHIDGHLSSQEFGAGTPISEI